MPVYEYCCQNCDQTFDVRASVKEKSEGLEVNCPDCGSKQIKQVFGSFAIGNAGKTDASSAPGCIPGSGCCG